MIAIPNMEKPKRCIECFLQDECEHNKDIYFIHEERPLDCPLIDIVRCGECKWWNEDHKTGGEGLCENNIFGWSRPTDFCSYGERRT